MSTIRDLCTSDWTAPLPVPFRPGEWRPGTASRSAERIVEWEKDGVFGSALKRTRYRVFADRSGTIGAEARNEEHRGERGWVTVSRTVLKDEAQERTGSVLRFPDAAAAVKLLDAYADRLIRVLQEKCAREDQPEHQPPKAS